MRSTPRSNLSYWAGLAGAVTAANWVALLFGGRGPGLLELPRLFTGLSLSVLVFSGPIALVLGLIAHDRCFWGPQPRGAGLAIFAVVVGILATYAGGLLAIFVVGAVLFGS
jgi:hypothetical protein